MPLTVRQNGSVVGGQPNVVAASWFNDYHDLLTGVMTDQDMTPKADFILGPIGASPSVAPTVALAAGSTLGIGVYQYEVTFIKQGASGESAPSPVASITTTSGNQAVNVSAIPLGPTGTSARRLYRTLVGGSTFYLVTQIGDNTSTTYADTRTDAQISPNAVAPPTYRDSFGGRLIINNAAGSNQVVFSPDGYGWMTGALWVGGGLTTDNGHLFTDGSGNLTAAGYQVAGGYAIPSFGPGSYTTARRIFVQPATPTGTIAKGDVWIKTPF